MAKLLPEEFSIVQMSIKDADDRNTVFWTVKDWDLSNPQEQRVELPAAIMTVRAISREIVFYSKQAIQDFTIVQKMMLNGFAVE